MRKLLVLLVILAIVPVSAGAEMCVLDVVPAATILVPYFEVDLADSSGRNTIVLLHNATAEPTLVHVIFWTNWGAPVIDYDVFLTGFDVQTFDLRDHFEGNVAVTADEERDPDDTISPSGDPTWDGTFDCEHFLPFVNPAIASMNLERLVDGHTGEPISTLSNECLGGPTSISEADLAVGYLTMDVTGRCSLEYPDDGDYFGGTDPIALDENRLWAEVLYVDPSREVALSMSAVHVEADPDFDATSTSTGATFYGRFTAGSDHREPLPSEWGAPVNNAVSDLLVWRESPPFAISWDCSIGPEWMPLEENEVTCFDPTGTAAGLCGGTPCFPLALQRTPVFPLGWPGGSTGWCRLDLGTGDFEYRQSWVGVIDDEGGSRVSGMPGIVMDGACQAP